MTEERLRALESDFVAFTKNNQKRYLNKQIATIMKDMKENFMRKHESELNSLNFTDMFDKVRNVKKRSDGNIDFIDIDGNITTYEQSNPEIFGLLSEYSDLLNRQTTNIIATMKKVDDSKTDTLLREQYQLLCQSYDNMLPHSISDEQREEAMQILSYLPKLSFNGTVFEKKSIHGNIILSKDDDKDNVWFEALKKAYYAYQTNALFRSDSQKIPEVIFQDKKGLLNRIKGGITKVSSTGMRKLKSKLGYVKKLDAPNQTNDPSNNITVTLADIRNYVSNWSQEEQEKFINSVETENDLIYHGGIHSFKRTVKTAPAGVNKIASQGLYNKEHKKQIKIDKIRDKYYSNKMFDDVTGQKINVRVKNVFGDYADNRNYISNTKLAKLIEGARQAKLAEEARQIKLTEEAAKKLEENNIENVNTDILRLENKYDTLLENKTSSQTTSEEPIILSTTAEEKATENPIMPPVIEPQIHEEEVNDNPEVVEEKKTDISKDNLKNIVLGIFDSFSAEDFEKMAEDKRKQEIAQDSRFATYDKYKTRLDKEKEMEDIWAEVGAVLDNEEYVKEAMKRAEEHAKVNEYRASLEKEAFEHNPKREEIIKKSRLDSVKNKINIAAMNGMDLDTLAELNNVVSDTIEGKSR